MPLYHYYLGCRLPLPTVFTLFQNGVCHIASLQSSAVNGKSYNNNTADGQKHSGAEDGLQSGGQ
jgi:hypothetical protein